MPAIAALHTNVTESLKESARTATGASHAWTRSALLVAEVSVALVLVTACGAFLKSLKKMQAVDPGFRADHVLAAGYQLPEQQYGTERSAEAFGRSVVERLSSTPGMLNVGISSVLPASGMYGGSGYTIDGESEATWKLQFAMFYSRARHSPASATGSMSSIKRDVKKAPPRPEDRDSFSRSSPLCFVITGDVRPVVHLVRFLIC